MVITLFRHLVLQTATAVSAYSPSFRITPDNAFEAEAVIINITGGTPSLCVAAEITNDDQNWIEIAELCTSSVPGATYAPVYSLANAKCRLRFDFSVVGAAGTCILASNIRTTKL